MTGPDGERPRTSRIAIVEDDSVVRDHFVDIISTAPDLDLAGAAATLSKARGLVALKPDLFLVDVGLPDGSGLDLVADIKASGAAKALVVTTFGDRETVVRAIRSGADGYLLKDGSESAVLEGIRVTLEGGAPVSAAAAVFLLERLRGGESTPASLDGTLTSRETELLEQFARGASYKEAARALGISPLTVGNHVKSIYRKLAVTSRGEAVYEAVRRGQLKF